MIDIQLLRNDLDGVAARLAQRGYTLDTAAFVELEADRKSIQTRTQDLQARRNSTSKAIGVAKGKGEDTAALMQQVGSIGDELSLLERQLDALQNRQRDWLLTMPNLADSSVPVGNSEAENI